jgi:DNA repair photolyase
MSADDILLDRLTSDPNPAIKGRGASFSPENRFERIKIETDLEWLDDEPLQKPATEYFVDNSKSILAKNDSYDLSFTYSINPYRGCEHGCIYCYARPTHEYFGLSAGLDFETKIMVKPNAPRLLEEQFRSKKWTPQVVAFSGNTDCYQPIEKEMQITRKCLEVFLKFRNPVGVITKNALILRDLDILTELAKYDLVVATVSVTTLDNQLARIMEPRTSAPAKRLDALEQLVAAGIPTNVNVAPVIPGLTDHEIPAILKAAADRGVKNAAYILLRLPYSVKELFFSWLNQHYPNQLKKVMHSVQETRDGQLNDPNFKTRFSGVGVRATAINRMFNLCGEKYGFNKLRPNLCTDHFRRGNLDQGELF